MWDKRGGWKDGWGQGHTAAHVQEARCHSVGLIISSQSHRDEVSPPNRAGACGLLCLTCCIAVYSCCHLFLRAWHVPLVWTPTWLCSGGHLGADLKDRQPPECWLSVGASRVCSWVPSDTKPHPLQAFISPVEGSQSRVTDFGIIGSYPGIRCRVSVHGRLF